LALLRSGDVRHGGLFSHDMDSGTSFLAPVLVGGISDAFDGGYKGLSYALYVTSAFGFLAAIFWWKAAHHIDADMKKVKGN
jgi:hypothetical protein